jgi:hypothetical protein
MVRGPSNRPDTSMTMRAIAAIPALLIVHVLAAEEPWHVRDLRVTGTMLPESDEIDVTFRNPGGSFDVTIPDSELQESPRVAVSLTESFTDGERGAWILSLGFVHTEQKTAKHANDAVLFLGGEVYGFEGSIKQTTNLGELGLGYGFPLGRHAHFELSAFGGIGVAKSSARGPNTDGGVSRFESASHVCFEYGGRAGLFWTFASQLQLGVDGGWIVSMSETEIVYRVFDSGSFDHYLNQTNDIRTSGPFYSASVGVRF